MDQQATATTLASVDPLVLSALAGDRHAERELCARLLPAIRAFAARRLRAASAEDFSQDVLTLFIEALRSGRVQDGSRLAAFALGICRNLARERARNDERRRELSDLYGPTSDDLETWDAPLRVRRDHLEDCFSQLTERSRQVMRSTFCEDSLDSDIARLLAISEANVRIIRHRTLAVLRDCLSRPISWTGHAGVAS
ncbi:MAG TPA: sigma-70 family RNA polymerase sigma factor [Polyangiaceae bacterium]|nr:sigma-70 family RNA polymerase sigma factor [Polyangiaceae bacterium]